MRPSRLGALTLALVATMVRVVNAPAQGLRQELEGCYRPDRAGDNLVQRAIASRSIGQLMHRGPAAPAAELLAVDRDDLDAAVARAVVRVDVPLVGHDDAGRDREHVVAVVPLLTLGLEAIATGLELADPRHVERPGERDEEVVRLLDREARSAPGVTT